MLFHFNSKLINPFALIIICLSINLTFAQAEVFTADVEEHTEAVIPGERVAFFGHSTQFWDQDSSTQPIVQRLLMNSDQSNLTKVGIIGIHAFVNEADASRYFLTGDDVNYVVESQGGQHKLQFPETNTFFIVGGNLAKCLCEGVRDIMRGTLPYLNESRKQVEMIFIKEGLYDPYWRMDEDQKISDYVQRYFANRFNCSYHNYFLYPKPVTDDVLIKAFNEDKEVSNFYQGKLITDPNDERIQNAKKVVIIRYIGVESLESYL